MNERVNIKMSPEVRDRFNKKRDGEKQAVFLNELLDLYEVHEERGSDLHPSEGQIEEIVRDALAEYCEAHGNGDTAGTLSADEVREIVHEELQHQTRELQGGQL